MAKSRPTHEEVERDEVAESVHSAVLFLQRHYLMLIGLLLCVLVGILVRATIVSRNARISSQVNIAITNDLTRLNEIEATTDEAQRLDAANKLVADLDGLIKEFSTHPMARQALFLQGRAYYAADQFEKAQAAYRQFIDQAQTNEDRARGDVALGYAYENQSFLVAEQSRQRDLLTAALGSYENAAQRVPGSYLYYYALMGQARIHEALNQKDEAIKLYQKVLDERPIPSSVVTTAEKSPKSNQAITDPMEYIRRQLDQMESQFSFQQTAKLRLANLKGGEVSQPGAETPAVATP